MDSEAAPQKLTLTESEPEQGKIELVLSQSSKCNSHTESEISAQRCLVKYPSGVRDS